MCHSLAQTIFSGQAIDSLIPREHRRRRRFIHLVYSFIHLLGGVCVVVVVVVVCVCGGGRFNESLIPLQLSPFPIFLTFFLYSTFLFLFCFEISLRVQSTLPGQDQSTVVQRAEATMDDRSLTSCV